MSGLNDKRYIVYIIARWHGVNPGRYMGIGADTTQMIFQLLRDLCIGAETESQNTHTHWLVGGRNRIASVSKRPMQVLQH